MQEIEINDLDVTCNINNSQNYFIPCLQYKDIKYCNFFENFIYKNLPCIIKNVSSEWGCSTKWILNDSINFDYLRNTYGYIDAPVAYCDKITCNSQCKTDMKVSEFINYLENKNREKLLYLKDWHLKKINPNDNFYEVPSMFASDWLNEYAIDNHKDDFMFVYIGPRGSWTPLHADVYNSYSWSVNVIGRKKWILFPPGEEEKLKDNLGNLPLLFDTDKNMGINYLEIIQEQGDAIFVPSGWYHQVVNTLDTISINHNWVNACNIQSLWNALQESLLCVENEIKEFKNTPEFDDQCQLILKSLFGMDISDFIDFICYIGNKRILQVNKEINTSFQNFKLGKNHVIFDLKKILIIIDLIQNHSLYVQKYFVPGKYKCIEDCTHMIKNVLCNNY